MAFPVDLICFDLGRVLIRICDDWPQACRLAGVDWPADVAPATPHFRQLILDFDLGQVGETEFCRRMADCASLTPQQVRAASMAILREPFAGAQAMLQELHAAGVRTACLSNTNELHWRQMTTPGSPWFLPLDQLTWRFASHLLHQRKPEAAIYRQVESISGFAPSRIAFFDDLPENVAAARSRGWQAQVITPDTEPMVQIRRHLKDLSDASTLTLR